MGIFVQYALFPGCDEISARTAVETAVKDLSFCIDLDQCRYSQSCKGAQVLIEGNLLGFSSCQSVVPSCCIPRYAAVHL